MPVFLPAAIAATTAFTVAGVAVTYGALATAATLIASVGYSNYARRKAERAAASTLQDRTFPVRASDAPQTIIYGETRVSGVIVYGASHDGGTDLGIDDEVTLVYALAGHELAAINDVWFNDKPVGALDGNGEVQSGSDWYKAERVGATEQFTPSSNSQTFTLSESAPVESIDSVAFVYDTGDDRAQSVLQFGVDWTASAGAKTVTLINSGNFNAVGVPITVTYTASRGSSKARIRKFLGIAAGERDTDLETWTAADDAPWTSAHIGRGIPRLHVTHRWDDTIYTAGVPAASAIVRGKKVYDPRADSTNGGSGSQRVATPSTWAWSNNPALCAADYLMSPLGFNVAASKVNWPSVIAAANACDEVVNSTTRYKCDGVLSTDASRKANLEAILSSMVGSAYYSGGQWFIRAGVANTATPFDLDESDLAGGEITVIARQPRNELFNAIRGRFRDPGQLYAITDFPPYASSTYAAQDNGEVVYTDIELPMTQSAIAAQRIAKLVLNRARQAVTVVADFKLGAYRLQPGDTVNLTLARYGFSAKLFRVVEREFADLSRVRLVLQEEAPEVYAWDFDADATVLDPAPNTNLPDPRYVAAPTNVQFIPDSDDPNPTSWYTRADGTAVPYLDITWNAPTSPDVYTEIFWKRAEDTAFQLIRTAANATTARLEPVSGGDVLNLYLVHVSSTGARSAIWWVPTLALNDRLPINGQPVGTLSANLLANASWEYGVERWTVVGPASFEKETKIYPISGPISNARLQVNSTLTGNNLYAWVDSDRVPIMPGRRYVAFAGMIPWAVSGNVEILWFVNRGDESSIPGSTSWGTIIPGKPSDGASNWRPDNLRDYQVSFVFGTAPAAARYAMVRLVANSPWTASDPFGAKYLWLAQPFLGQVPLGVSELPPWDAGGAPTLGTGGLTPGAATDITSGNKTGFTFSSPGPGSADITLFSITANAAGVLEVSATFEASGSGTGGGGGGENRISAGLYETSKGLALISRELLTAPANETRRATATLPATIPVGAGETVSPILRVSRTRFGIVGGVTVGNTTDGVGTISWRATLIKR